MCLEINQGVKDKITKIVPFIFGWGEGWDGLWGRGTSV